MSEEKEDIYDVIVLLILSFATIGVCVDTIKEIWKDEVER